MPVTRYLEGHPFVRPLPPYQIGKCHYLRTAYTASTDLIRKPQPSSSHSTFIRGTTRSQARRAGLLVRSLIGPRETVQFYVSPYVRTRRTFDLLCETGKFCNYRSYEEPRLREQDYGNFQDPDKVQGYQEERSKFGHFFYRFPSGESGADVYDRVSTFMETLYRDFSKESYPENVVLVTHGLTIRLFLMRWFHWTVEFFETLSNPENCEIFVMVLQDDHRYKLSTELKHWATPSTCKTSTHHVDHAQSFTPECQTYLRSKKAVE